MRKELKAAIFVVFIVVVIYMLKFSPLADYFWTEEGRQIFGNKFNAYLTGMGIWAPVIFVLCYAVSLILFVPASVFTTLGGLIFGNWAGLGLNLIGAYIGGAISFYISRYLLRDMASKILSKGHFKKLDDKAAEHGFSVIVYLRLLFVPYTYLNFAVGLSKIKFKDFFWATVVGVVPGLIVITFLAAAMKELTLSYASHKSLMITVTQDIWRPDVILPLMLFGFSFFIPTIVKHFKKRFNVTPEIEEEAGEEQ